MIAIKKILHPTDFSTSARAALPVASALARDYGATLLLLHVRATPTPVFGEFGAIPTEPRESDAAVLDRLRQWLTPTELKTVEFQVRDGAAADEIIRCAAEEHCDMIVLGTHGRSGLGRFFVGSVAEAVMEKAPCPVLTVRPPAPTTAQAELTEPGVPTLSADLLQTVRSVANLPEAEVIRNALRSEGINAFVEGAQQGGFAGTMGFPVQVQVALRDFDRANRILQQIEEHATRG